MLSALLKWIKDLFSGNDNSLIGLTQLSEVKKPVKEISEQNFKKAKKDIKISDLMKGETY